ncbi:MAG: TauD/TfdA family dioxygenase [Actinomycetota bacterium]|nr:TauD/TfdA family dioxygenase [Actinomycetota bacterium]
MTFEPLTVSGTEVGFGARVESVKLADIDDATFAELHQQWLHYGLLVFENQHLTHTEQIEFGSRFGDLEIKMAELSNIRPDGSLRPDDGTDDMMKVNRGNMSWHHDSTYMPVQAKGAVFSAEVVPETGGATGFADMRLAYDALDEATRERIQDLRAHHSLYHSQAKVGHHAAPVDEMKVKSDDESKSSYGGYGFHDGPVSLRPLVKSHPETGRKNLLVDRHAYDVVGMSSEESQQLLAELNEFATQSQWTYHHQWAAGDTVLWDNRALMHQATPWPMDQPRVMWHTRLAGDPKSEGALTE